MQRECIEWPTGAGVAEGMRSVGAECSVAIIIMHYWPCSIQFVPLTYASIIRLHCAYSNRTRKNRLNIILMKNRIGRFCILHIHAHTHTHTWVQS